MIGHIFIEKVSLRHISTHIQQHTPMHTHTITTHTYVHLCILTYKHTHTYAHSHIDTQTYVCTYHIIPVSIFSLPHTHMNSHTNTHTTQIHYILSLQLLIWVIARRKKRFCLRWKWKKQDDESEIIKSFTNCPFCSDPFIALRYNTVSLFLLAIAYSTVQGYLLFLRGRP